MTVKLNRLINLWTSNILEESKYIASIFNVSIFILSITYLL